MGGGGYVQHLRGYKTGGGTVLGTFSGTGVVVPVKGLEKGVTVVRVRLFAPLRVDEYGRCFVLGLQRPWRIVTAHPPAP